MTHGAGVGAVSNDKFRYYNTATWRDEWYGELTKDEKHLWNYLLLSPDSNLAGIYRSTYRLMAFETGIDQAEVQRIFSEVFEPAGKAFYVHGFVVMKNWFRHQKFNSKHVSAVQTILNALPENVKLRLCDKTDPCYLDFSSLSNAHSGSTDSLSIAYPEPIDSAPIYFNFNSNFNNNTKTNNTYTKKNTAYAVSKKPDGFSASTDPDHNASNEAVEYFYELFIKLFGVQRLKRTDKRKKKLQVRIRENGKKELALAFHNASKSPHHNGDKGWKADFDWIIDTTEKVERLANLIPEGTQQDSKHNRLIQEHLRKRQERGEV